MSKAAEEHVTYIEAKNLPSHVGIIMDGNGRWAQMRGQDRAEGHKRGAETVRRIVRASRRLGVRALTLYAFSEQNWSRPECEKDALFALLHEFLVTEREELLGNGIRLAAVGNVEKLPENVRTVLDVVCEATKNESKMTLALALSYGGREEIATAARELAREVCGGTRTIEGITEAALRERIPSLRVGDPDLVIRTGGEHRISNFLLYGLAYAELYFSEALWPDFGVHDYFEAIASYQSRERRFGLVGKGAAATPGQEVGTPA